MVEASPFPEWNDAHFAFDMLVAKIAPEDSDRLLNFAVEHLNKFPAL